MPLTPYDGWRKRHLTKYFLKHFSGFHKESWIAKVFLFLRLLTTFHGYGLTTWSDIWPRTLLYVFREANNHSQNMSIELEEQISKSPEQIIICLINGLERRFGNRQKCYMEPNLCDIFLKTVPLAAKEKTCTDTLSLEMLLSVMSTFGVLYYDYIYGHSSPAARAKHFSTLN